MTPDLIVYNGPILTENENDELIPDGLICIQNGQIVAIEQRSHDEPLPAAGKMIDAQGGLILPGLVNTHTHLPMSLFRGLADDLPLDTWLNEHIFPAESRYINPETVRVGTLLSAAELLLSGTTTCCDGYFYEENVAEALVTIGLRAVVGQGVVDFPAPGVPEPNQNIEVTADFVDRFNNHHPLITPAVFCHSPYTCGPETLKAAKQLATRAGVLFQIHAAETETEAALIPGGQGRSPIAYLHDLGLLDNDTLLVHCVHLSQADIDIIAASGAKVSHNPESNMKLAAGVAPVPSLLAADVVVGLGTDGSASNNNLDLFREMDTTAKLHKVISRDPTVLDVRRVFKMATIEGARAIGCDDTVGSIEVGKQADIIVVDTRRPHLTPLYNPWSQLVYSARGSDVSHVIVGGRVVVDQGRLRTLDLDEILYDAARAGSMIYSG